MVNILNKDSHIEDRPTGDQRPTNDLTFGKIQMAIKTAISPQRFVRSASCLVYRVAFSRSADRMALFQGDISVGAQSTFGGRHFCPKIYV